MRSLEVVGETLVREEADGGWAGGEQGAVPEKNANSQEVSGGPS